MEVHAEIEPPPPAPVVDSPPLPPPTMEEKVAAMYDVLFGDDEGLCRLTVAVKRLKREKSNFLELRQRFRTSLEDLNLLADELHRRPSSPSKKRTGRLERLMKALRPFSSAVVQDQPETNPRAGTMDRAPEFYKDPTDPTNATRFGLREAVDAARSAVETGHGDIQAAVERRSEMRRAHVNTLTSVMETLLREADVQTLQQLELRIREKNELKQHVAGLLERASNAASFLQEKFQQLGVVADAGTRNLRSLTETWLDPEVVKATDEALRALEDAPMLHRQLECSVDPASLSTTYRWVPPAGRKEQRAEQRAERSEREDQGLQEMGYRLELAQQAFEREREGWMQEAKAQELPVQQLLAEGVQQDGRLGAQLILYQQVQEAYVALDAEKAYEEQLEFKYEKERPVAMRTMTSASHRRGDKQAELKRAVLDFEDADRQLKRAASPSQKEKAALQKAADTVAKVRKDVRLADDELGRAMGPVVALAREFPEMMEGLDEFRCGLPYELLEFWSGSRSLSEFDKCEQIPGDHRHTTWKARAPSGELFAIKEYKMANLRSCLREAALLVRLRHPHVVRVVSVFVNESGSCLYMQMPFYSKVR